MIRNSGSRERNPNLKNWSKPTQQELEDKQDESIREDYEDHGNIQFFADALRALREGPTVGEAQVIIGLVGQRDIPGAALRRAQAILRWDLRPSLWSHTFLLTGPLPEQLDQETVSALPLREVSIHSRTGAFPEPADNAVTSGSLHLYGSSLVDANVALVNVSMTQANADAVLLRATRDVNLDRLRYNLWETLGVWEGYLWSGGIAENPLRDGYPMFSSAFVEYCFEAIQLDLAPATSERNSAPEHLWNAAAWWYEAFKDHPISGRYLLRDKYCAMLDPKELKRSATSGTESSGETSP